MTNRLSVVDSAAPNDAHRPHRGFGAAVLDAIPDATAILDRQGRITAVNRAWRMFTLDNGGHPEATGVGVSYMDVCARAAGAGCNDAIEVLEGLKTVLDGETVESEREYPCPSPTAGRWFMCRITPIQGSVGGAVASHVNISRQKMSERELSHQASHDSLTGLANRMLFTTRLADLLGLAPTSNRRRRVGLLYIDLDDFKPVNDTFGHHAGDEVLLTVAHRLQSQVQTQDTAARLGGDEFAICAAQTAPAELDALAGRIRASLAHPHQIHGQQVHVGGSIGIHLATPGESVAAALQLADLAMYAVKRARPDHSVPAQPDRRRRPPD